MSNYNVLIMGYGKSGKSVEEVLKKEKVNYKIYDQNIKIEGGNYISILDKNTLQKFNLIVISPSIDIKSKYVKLAKRLNIEVIGELEFGYRYLNCNLISVTGTNGKTTTVSLTNKILSNCKKTMVAGNIGTPLTEVAYKNNDLDCVVCEVSSFQLESIKEYKSNINIFLNIGDDHLDRYKSLEKYINAKSNLFKNNSEKSVNILNADDGNVCKYFNCVKGIKIYVSSVKEVKGIYIQNEVIKINIGKNKRDFCSIKEFNFPNLFATDILSSICVGVLLNIPDEQIISTIKEFKLLNSRVEKVCAFNGVTYINDSKATNMHAVVACVNSIENDIILLLGGRNKGFNFKKLLKVIPKNVKTVIAFGESSNNIFNTFSKNSGIDVYRFESLDEAINKAWAIAWVGSFVVLSPACSSFDEFSSYEERGKFFKNKILKLVSQNEK